MFRDTLDITGQTEYVASAIGAVATSMADIFRSLEATLPVSPEKLPEWHKLSDWLADAYSPAERIRVALSERIPSSLLPDVQRYKDSPLMIYAARAGSALAAWDTHEQERRWSKRPDVEKPLNEQEQLGREIRTYYAAAYPGQAQRAFEYTSRLKKTVYDYLQVHIKETCTESVSP